VTYQPTSENDAHA